MRPWGVDDDVSAIFTPRHLFRFPTRRRVRACVYPIRDALMKAAPVAGNEPTPNAHDGARQRFLLAFPRGAQRSGPRLQEERRRVRFARRARRRVARHIRGGCQAEQSRAYASGKSRASVVTAHRETGQTTALAGLYARVPSKTNTRAGVGQVVHRHRVPSPGPKPKPWGREAFVAWFFFPLGASIIHHSTSH